MHVLLSEGSSFSARETLTCLALAGHTVDVLDPKPACLSRFSNFVGRFYECPAMGDDPASYLSFVLNLLRSNRYDVFIPVHEQAYLFSKFADEIQPWAGVALSAFESFERLQGKLAFADLLKQLALRGPATRAINSEEELTGLHEFPFFIKTEFGNASAGVWFVADAFDLRRALVAIRDLKIFEAGERLLIQERCLGALEAVQGIFSKGRLLAWHSFRRVLEGARGGSALKESTSRPELRLILETLGDALQWHGSLHLEFFWDSQLNEPIFIDANPRLVEPVNALMAGLDLVDYQLRLSSGEDFPLEAVTSSAGVKTHNFLGSVVGLAAGGASRWRLLREATQILLGRGHYQGSRESLTPVRFDRRSLVPVLMTSLRALRRPSFAREVGGRTVQRYSLSSKAIEFVRELPSLEALDLPILNKAKLEETAPPA